MRSANELSILFGGYWFIQSTCKRSVYIKSFYLVILLFESFCIPCKFPPFNFFLDILGYFGNSSNHLGVAQWCDHWVHVPPSTMVIQVQDITLLKAEDPTLNRPHLYRVFFFFFTPIMRLGHKIKCAHTQRKHTHMKRCGILKSLNSIIPYEN